MTRPSIRIFQELKLLDTESSVWKTSSYLDDGSGRVLESFTMNTVQVHEEGTSYCLEDYSSHSPVSEIILVKLKTPEGEGG